MAAFILGTHIPFMAAAAVVGGVVFFIRGFGTWRERRLIQNTPTAHIRSMAMGLVEVIGTVEPRSSVKAPFSGHDCAYWQVDISRRTKDGWSIVHHNASGAPFFIEDGTAAALVYPQGAECKLTFGVEEVCNGPFLPPCYSEYIQKQGLTLVGVMSVGQMRFRERVVQEGQRVFVLGTAMPRSHAVSISGADEALATGTDGKPSRITELDQATVAVVRKGENETTFILSQESERALSLDMGIHAVAQLVGGPLLSLFGLGWILLSISTRHVIH